MPARLKIKQIMVKWSLSYALARAADVILPPQSLLSGELTQGGVEAELWAHISFLDEPCCEICGFPFDYDVGSGIHCGDCIARPPAYDRARAAFIYNDSSRRLVLGFKHGGRTEGLSMFAAQMRRAGRLFWDDADYLIPVPHHPSRLIRRRFNQSALLARALSRLVKPVFAPDILFRNRATASQGGQTVKGRFRNVQGAFTVPEKARDQLAGRRVVLIDDVMTTGATLQSCARTLKRAGAAHIDVVTLARTVREKSGEQIYGQD